MPLLPEERQQYQAFVAKQADKLKSVDFDNEQILWHYTTGDGLLGIIESGKLYATQVSCLNDATEVRYSNYLLRDAWLEFFREKSVELPQLKEMADRYRIASAEDPSNPLHASSNWFVTCFSRNGDDLSQWRAYCGGENGYAIGFRASGLFGPTGPLVRVNYDTALHKTVAAELVRATFDFFQEGLARRNGISADAWTAEFIPEWFQIVDRLAPLVKDSAFKSEEEYRIVRLAQRSDLSQLRFRQKRTLMSRHLPLAFASNPMLPIEQILVGPSRHKEITRAGVDLLLQQKGYPSGLVTISAVPFQLT